MAGSGQFAAIFDGFSGGVVMGLITLSVVFLAISGLALIISGVKYVVLVSEAMGKRPRASVAAKPDVDRAPVSMAGKGAVNGVPGMEPEAGDVVAAIAAVVAVMTGGTGRVRSVRPVPAAGPGSCSAWKVASRMEGLEGF